MENGGNRGLSRWRTVTGWVLAALLVSVAPLAYGTVDRAWQLGLVVVFGVSVWVVPPRIPRLPPWVVMPGVLVFGLLALAAFSPASWHAMPRWRDILENGYGFDPGPTFAPSVPLALMQFAAIALAVIWVFWVRTLASSRGGGVIMLGGVVLAALLTAGVSFWMEWGGMDRIYGVRAYPGWQGFGPFPNRNHTACVLAMGAVAAAGLLWHGVARRSWLIGLPFALASVLLAGALVASQSRGALLGLVAGLGLLGGCVILSSRRRMLSVLVGVLVGVVGVVGVLVFGGGLVERFTDPERGGDWATGGRLAIWPDVIRCWLDSPWIGHGLGSFEGVFPFYQEVWMDNTIVIHPESSWLQWLVEMGALPLAGILCVAGAGVVVFLRGLGGFGVAERALRVAAACAVTVMAVHSLVDVPGHRWGSALIALTALGVVFRVSPDESSLAGRTGVPARFVVRILPMVVAAWMALPLVPHAPPWSPLGLERFLGTLGRRDALSPATVDRYLEHYPLDRRLHELAGALKLRSPGLREQAWRHFGIMSRLMPGAWSVPAQQAILATPVDRDMAAHYWSEAVRRAGARSYEVMRMAFRYVAATPEGIAYWECYARLNPDTLLTLAEVLPVDQARPLYDEWIRRRADRDDLHEHEILSFYRQVPRLGGKSDLVDWIGRHIGRAPTDQLHWIRAFREMGEYRTAWTFAEPLIPDGPGGPGGDARRANDLASVRSAYLADPDDPDLARRYVEALEAAGEADAAEREIERLMGRAGVGRVPPWFLWKLAMLRADRGDYQGALEVAPIGK